MARRTKEEMDYALKMVVVDAGEGIIYWKDKGEIINGRGREAGTLRKKTGYKSLMIKMKNGKYVGFAAHRLIFYSVHGFLPQEVDHINRNSSDNRIQNLRASTRVSNSRNRSIASNNTSGHPGVSWAKSCNKWKVEIKYNGKRKYLGCYDDLEYAARIRDRAARMLFGEFASVSTSTV